LELSDQHQFAPVPMERLNQIPRPIVNVLDRLLNKEASRRFQRPAELGEELVKILEPEERRVATDSLGAKTPARRLPGSLENKRRVVSDLKRSALAWLLVSAISVLDLVSVWHSLPAHVRSLLGSRDKARVEQSIAVLPFEKISPKRENVYFTYGVQDEGDREGARNKISRKASRATRIGNANGREYTRRKAHTKRVRQRGTANGHE